MSVDEARSEIQEAMARYTNSFYDAEGAVVLTFVVVAEVITPKGTALVEVCADNGEAISPWRRDGLLFNALHDPWYRKMGREE